MGTYTNGRIQAVLTEEERAMKNKVKLPVPRDDVIRDMAYGMKAMETERDIIQNEHEEKIAKLDKSISEKRERIQKMSQDE